MDCSIVKSGKEDAELTAAYLVQVRSDEGMISADSSVPVIPIILRKARAWEALKLCKRIRLQLVCALFCVRLRGW